MNLLFCHFWCFVLFLLFVLFVFVLFVLFCLFLKYIVYNALLKGWGELDLCIFFKKIKERYTRNVTKYYTKHLNDAMRS